MQEGGNVQSVSVESSTKRAPEFKRNRSERKYRDVVFAIVFTLLSMAIFVYGCYGLNKLRKRVKQTVTVIDKGLPFGERISQELEEGLFKLVEEHAGDFAQILMLCVAFAAVFGFAYIYLLKYFVKTVVRFVIACTFITTILFIIVNFVIANIPFAVLGILYLIYKIIWYTCMKERLAFARAVVVVSVKELEKLGPSAFVIVLLLLIVQALWCIVSAGAFYAITKGTFEILVILMFFWGYEVIGNIIHVSMSHAIGAHLVDDTLPHSNFSSLVISVTVSFGSICLGSLLVALLKVLQYFFKRWKRSKNPCIKICGLCCFFCLQRLLEFFNAYAFVQVALFGTSYMQSARTTVVMLKDNAVDSAVNNVLVEDIVGMGTFIGGLLTGSLACALTFVFDLPLVVAISVVASACLAGYAMVYVPMNVLHASVATVFTYWALFPDSAERLPELQQFQLQNRSWKKSFRKNKAVANADDTILTAPTVSVSPTTPSVANV